MMRGQSSLEYLMTYGWALIILAAVLTILYSVGVFDPKQYMNEECLFQPSLQCKSMSLTEGGKFNLQLNNGLGYEIDEVSAELTMLSTGETVPADNSQGLVKQNKPIVVSALFNQHGALRAGTLEKIRVKLTYKVNDQPYTTTGVVAVRVSPSSS